MDQREYRDTLRQLLRELAAEPQLAERLSRLYSFPKYSLVNRERILTQMADATWVEAASTWRKMGRTPRKGEHPILIIAPSTIRRRERVTRTVLKVGEDGSIQPVEETTWVTREVITGWKDVPVWDISQTEGEEVQPSFPTPQRVWERLGGSGDPPRALAAFVREQAARDLPQEAGVLAGELVCFGVGMTPSVDPGVLAFLAFADQPQKALEAALSRADSILRAIYRKGPED